MNEAFVYTCCACGKPTSLGPWCTVRGVHQSMCRDCMVADCDGSLTFIDCPEPLLRAALAGTPPTCQHEQALAEAELKRRESIA